MTSNRPQTLRPDQARCLGLSGNDRFWRTPPVYSESIATIWHVIFRASLSYLSATENPTRVPYVGIAPLLLPGGLNADILETLF